MKKRKPKINEWTKNLIFWALLLMFFIGTISVAEYYASKQVKPVHPTHMDFGD